VRDVSKIKQDCKTLANKASYASQGGDIMQAVKRDKAKVLKLAKELRSCGLISVERLSIIQNWAFPIDAPEYKHFASMALPGQIKFLAGRLAVWS